MGTSTTDTWGMSGATFLTLYLGLCGLVVLAGLLWRRRPLPARGADGAVGVYGLALLNGGPALAVTSAAARLRQGGHLLPGERRRTLVAAGRPAGAADPLERAVLEAVERTPNISTRTLRREIEASPALAAARSGLEAAGLLLDRAGARRLWLARILAGAVLLAAGVARIVAGSANHRPVGFLVMVTLAVAVAWVVAARQRPWATGRGRAVLAAHRRDGKGLRRGATAPADIPLAVALYGAGALWAADPAFASTWGVSRDAHGAYGGYSGGGGGCGGGGCGGGGCGG
jgi:uncharacterized protein (TIGR04222 family)